MAPNIVTKKTMKKPETTLSCVVERVFPFGVFVRLDDGSQGYIRKRELTLFGDIDPLQVVSEGEVIQAVILHPSSHGKTAELSLAAVCSDPWPEFVHRHQLNSSVPVTIKYLFPDGVLAEIIPGVDGFIPLDELTLDKESRPEEIVWPGDLSEAIITRIDRSHKRVQLSIRQWVDRLAKVEPILAYIRRTQDTSESAVHNLFTETSEHPQADIKIRLEGPILVVEDQDSLRKPLVDWLLDQGCEAVGAESAEEALQICAEQLFSVAIIDLDMPVMNGIDLIRELRNHDYQMKIAVMSGPDMIVEQLPVLRQENVLTVFPKPLDRHEIRQTLLQIMLGEQPSFSSELDEDLLSEEVIEFQNLTTIMRGVGEITERLHRGVGQLVDAVRAHTGVIFQMDNASRRITVVTQSGQFLLHNLALYDLTSSPVKDVIVEGSILWENRVSEQQGRFWNLLGLLPFESCMGIPLEAAGRIEHALFLFHRERDGFSSYRLRDTLAYANLFCAALESQRLEERIQKVSSVLLGGQLASAFGHEVYNKVSGLDLQLTNIQSQLSQALRPRNDYVASQFSPDFLQAVSQAVDMAAELKRTVQDFQRLSRSSNPQMVDINQAVGTAKALVSPLALREKVQIRVELDDKLPLIAGSTIRMQHIFLNLMLNAVQHMKGQPEGRRVLDVSSTAFDEGNPGSVRIRISDTGPGIHKKLWDKVFAMGFTTRKEGSGLGLFIARSLVESIGGKIMVENSLMQLGTTFLVELPTPTKSSNSMEADS